MNEENEWAAGGVYLLGKQGNYLFLIMYFNPWGSRDDWITSSLVNDRIVK